MARCSLPLVPSPPFQCSSSQLPSVSLSPIREALFEEEVPFCTFRTPALMLIRRLANVQHQQATVTYS